ncbi:PLASMODESMATA CALLOSE-BINDING PROTEIN 3-like [Momordica charantia]|uniref:PLASMODESMATA CALLOSE-BINDING PROTEIN 3-like n=1 Tax=Momordica charantia TaxID=3673 RepID=A0A6J1C995_MOMCH|nr:PLASMODESMATA CALLOSE-BINDING PROTEIN 3-like [Momordica charantia]
MAALALAVLLLAAMAGHSSGSWCVCKDGLGDAALQKALDYACGAGADCNPIRQNAACFLPNTVRAHCSYAVNSYFQKKAQTQGSCDFAGVAAISTTDPSAAGCSYPSSAGGSGAGTTPVTTAPTPPGATTVPGMTSPVTRPPTTTTTTNPIPNNSSPTGVLGGAGTGTGVGPTGAGTTTTADESHGGTRLQHHTFLSLSIVLLLSLMQIIN